MKVSTTKLDNCQAVLDVEMEPSELQKAKEDAYRLLVKKTAVPGFRPGKAPREVLERHVGKAVLEREAYNQYIPKAYEEALKEAGLEAIGEPDIEIVKTEPLAFKATLSLRPVIELGDYEKIRVSIEPRVVTEEDVAKAVEKLRQRQATWEPVERPVELGDMVTINMVGKDAERVFLDHKGMQYDADATAQFPVRGFSDQLVGMTKGQEKEFPLVAPDDHPVETLKGKALDFRVELLETKAKKLAALDDDFARTMNYPSLEALRDKVATDLKAEAEADARRRAEDAAIDALLEISRVEYPPLLVERELERELRERGILRPKGPPPSPETVERLRPLVEERVRRSLALQKFADAEKIEASSEELDAEVERLATANTNKAAEVKKFFSTPGARRYIGDTVLTRKTMDRLVAIAAGKSR